MTSDSPPAPLLTVDHVRQWVAERDELAQQHERLMHRISAIQQKLDALSQLLPEDVVTGLIGRAAPLLQRDTGVQHSARVATAHKPIASRKPGMPDTILKMLSGERGGRAPAWLRAQMQKDPELSEKIERSPTLISNALTRLVQRDLVLRENGLYYTVEVYGQIQRGELEEERLENDGTPSFNRVMHRVMQERGGKFTASDAIAAAKEDPFLAEKFAEQPSRVYSWLSREVFKHRLHKAGEFYSYPPEGEEAPEDVNPSDASFARGGATPLFDNQHGQKPAD